MKNIKKVLAICFKSSYYEHTDEHVHLCVRSTVALAKSCHPIKRQ